MHVLAVKQVGTNSRGILEAMLRGIERAGHRVSVLDFARWPALLRRAGEREDAVLAAANEALASFAEIRRVAPVDLSVGLWGDAVFAPTPLAHADGRAMPLVEALGVPHLLYWIDAPWWVYGGRLTSDARLRERLTSAQHVHLTMSRSTAAELAGLWGWPNVLPIEYAVDEGVFTPSAAPPSHDLVMSNGGGDPPPTPSMLAALESADPDVESIRRERAEGARGRILGWGERFGAERAAVESFVDALLTERLADPHRPTLDQVRAAAARAPSGASAGGALLADLSLYRDVMMTAREIDNWRRPFDFTWLSRRCKALLVGWTALRDWPHAAEVAPNVPYHRLGRMYAMGRVGLNVMRWQDDTGLNIKPLELACCGVPALQARRADMDRILTPGIEMTVYDRPAEALEALRSLLGSPERRAALAAAARDRALRDHTWSVRFGQILGAVGRPADAPASRPHAATTVGEPGACGTGTL